jgi:hypothetical protein
MESRRAFALKERENDPGVNDGDASHPQKQEGELPSYRDSGLRFVWRSDTE